MAQKEFKVNDYITLKLEDEKTNIYVDGENFRQCKYLAFNIPVDQVGEFNDISSIDEMEQEDRAGEFIDLDISPEEEFWGHCSNLQAWTEHGYDSCLLHRSVAFPLLKRLTEAGDPTVKKVFKREIVSRLRKGFPPVVKFLNKEGFLTYLNNGEIERMFPECEFVEFKKKKFPVVYGILNLSNIKLDDINKVKDISKLTSLEVLDLSENRLKSIPETIGNLTSLKELLIWDNQLESLPESIGNLASLQELNLAINEIESLPESIGNLKSIKTLDLGGLKYVSCNVLESLPDSIGNLTSLQSLYLYRNQLKTLPESIGNLQSLKELDLYNNESESLPGSIGNLALLEYLKLSKNRLKTLPLSFKNLISLKKLHLKGNPLVKNPDSSTKSIMRHLELRGVEIRL